MPSSALTAKSVSRNKDSGTAFSKVCTISKCFHWSSLNINFLISQELQSKKNVKTISGPAESTNLIFQKLKCNPVSGETVPLMRLFMTSHPPLTCGSALHPVGCPISLLNNFTAYVYAFAQLLFSFNHFSLQVLWNARTAYRIQLLGKTTVLFGVRPLWRGLQSTRFLQLFSLK
jgi:hypothetical protein